jgi:nitrogen-specific signal transduction histidine kinase
MIRDGAKLSPPVSRLVHEIKSPLCNIYLACDVLNDSDLGETQRICLEIIMRGSVRINNLTDSILCSLETGEGDNKPAR